RGLDLSFYMVMMMTYFSAVFRVFYPSSFSVSTQTHCHQSDSILNSVVKSPCGEDIWRVTA
ncbi:hypothetical protein, partial [Microcoleus sp. B7-D4]|uniref:hypothetical protein n=1 Tax=Microcoleus sp. B7-D4 TaxID=2818696 RepID=UPI002FD4885D